MGARRGQQEASFQLPMLVGARTAGMGSSRVLDWREGRWSPSLGIPSTPGNTGSSQWRRGGAEGLGLPPPLSPALPLPASPPPSAAHFVLWWGAPEDAWKRGSTDRICPFSVQ